jgi:hypothetical protein
MRGFLHAIESYSQQEEGAVNAFFHPSPQADRTSEQPTASKALAAEHGCRHFPRLSLSHLATSQRPYAMHAPESRISFSLPTPAFDLGRMRPELWRRSSDRQTQLLSLRPSWEELLPALSRLDLVMACAAVGPLSIATALAPVRFTLVPDTSLWVCVESGTELDGAQLAAAAIVVENHLSYAMASLQFFDQEGTGVLKLLATNGTDLEALHDLACQFGCPHHSWPSQPIERALMDLSAPDPAALEALRAQWLSLTRTLPDDVFPGVPGLARLAALRAAGPSRAWQVCQKAALAAVGTLSLHHGPLGAAIRTAASFLPAGFYPLRHEACGCGTTFFSETVQLTVRRPSTADWEVWVTRFSQGTAEVRCLEFYLSSGHFCGGIGLRPEAEPYHHTLWNGVLAKPPIT